MQILEEEDGWGNGKLEFGGCGPGGRLGLEMW